VAALTFYGSYSQYIVLPVLELFPVPEEVDPAEAVTVAFNYVAAYQMLHRVAHVERGWRILIHGAGGGLGTAFLELGHLAGLEMYGTASKAKHALVSRLGAMPIDYHAEDFAGRARALTGGVGVDAVFDPMGSAHLKLSARAVRNGGTIVAFGYYQAANRGTGALRDILSQYLRLWLWSLPPGRKHVAFYDTRPTKRKHPDWYRDDLARLFALLAAGTLKPAIAARLPLEEAVIAHRKLEQAKVQGKLVLTPNPWSENRSLAGQAAAPGGALARRGLVGRAGRSASGGQELAGVWVDGLDGDLVARRSRLLMWLRAWRRVCIRCS
jgi:NADPH:quinone reductase-like Zn-dependent oxidoreductase